MSKDFTTISVEQMAAYLDSNLSQTEMTSVAAMIADDGNMQSLLHISEYIDESLNNNSNVLLNAPIDVNYQKDLDLLNFELPFISSEEVRNLASITPDFLPDNAFEIQPVDISDFGDSQLDTIFPSMDNDLTNNL